MLSVSGIADSAGASNYFEKDDYYLADSPPSQWLGQGAERLGLVGEVQPEDFKAMLDGKPPGGNTVGTMKNGEWAHKPGFDLTFSAPKSVSVMSGAGGDERLIQAHDRAVVAVLARIEKDVTTRIREHGEVRSEVTGNLAVATFRHDLSREEDPQLHTHSVLMNLTQSSDGQWRSLDFKPTLTKNFIKAAGLEYRQELAREVRALGYEIDSTKVGKDGAWSFEIRGVSEKVQEHFSTRSSQVEKALAERGKDRDTATAKEREMASLSTRTGKDKDVDREALRESWKADAARLGLDSQRLIRESQERAANPDFARKLEESSKVDAAKAVQWAVAHISDRDSQFSKQDLALAAYERGEGKASPEDIRAAISWKIENGDLLEKGQGKNGEMLTTKDGIETERQNLAMEQRGRGLAEAVAKPSVMDRVRGVSTPEAKAQAIVAKAEAESAKLGHSWTSDQRNATLGLLTDRNRVAAIQGAAGSAKTSTVIRTYAAQVEKAGGQVVGMAPTNTAAQQLKDGGGIEKSMSIARFMADLKMEEREIAKLRGEAKSHDFKAKGQEFKAERVGKTDGVRMVGKDPFKTVISQGVDGQWRRTDGLTAVVARAGFAAKTLYHEDRARVEHSKSDAFQKEADMRAEAMRGQTWVVDEASMVGAKDMNALLRAAEKYDAKVVLVGDQKQLASVGAGRAFAQLQDHGMKTYRLDEIVRQKDEHLKSAVKDSYEGKAAQALEKIDQKGGIVEIRNPGQTGKAGLGDRDAGMQNRAQAIAKEYASLPKGDREKTIVVAFGNDDRKAVNEAVRDALKERGDLGKADTKAEILVSKSLTDAQKQHAGSYEKGDVVRFNSTPGKALKEQGIEKGSYAKVVGREGDKLRLETKDGKQVDWNPSARGSAAAKTETFKPEQRGFAQGDKVQFTRNDADKGITSRSGGTVEKIDQKSQAMTVRTDAGKEVKLDMAKPQHLEHGYAQTAHAAQGLTAERALVHSESHRTNLTNQRSMYVAISRAVRDVKVYTDNKDALKQAMSERTGEKAASMDNVQKAPITTPQATKPEISPSKTDAEKQAKTVTGKEATAKAGHDKNGITKGTETRFSGERNAGVARNSTERGSGRDSVSDTKSSASKDDSGHSKSDSGGKGMDLER